MEMISSLASKWLPTQRTKIDINDDGTNLTATVVSFGKIKSGELKNESGRTMTLQGAGFAAAFGMDDETFTMAPSASQWSDPDLPLKSSSAVVSLSSLIPCIIYVNFLFLYQDRNTNELLFILL